LLIYVCMIRILLKTPDVEAKLLLASFIGLSVVGLFLHVWADDPTAMTWWGLAGLLAFEQTRKAAA